MPKRTEIRDTVRRLTSHSLLQAALLAAGIGIALGLGV
jgi:hypothetical protein